MTSSVINLHHTSLNYTQSWYLAIIFSFVQSVLYVHFAADDRPWSEMFCFYRPLVTLNKLSFFNNSVVMSLQLYVYELAIYALIDIHACQWTNDTSHIAIIIALRQLAVQYTEWYKLKGGFLCEHQSWH